MRAGTKSHYTFEDYLAMPEDNARRHEIIDGELFVTAAPRPRHQDVVTNLTILLGTLVRERRLGKITVGGITVRVAEDTVLEPDLIFVRADRLHIVDPVNGAVGPPDLVVEVLSPSNRGHDRNLERRLYLEFGVRELWIVDADENTIEVWRRGALGPEFPRGTLEWSVGDTTLEVPLADVFQE
jgi:Uma2 family endonuclease